ncbi:MAG: D,D-dipeptide ABC transporter permease, partial [Dehalococcoidia bacterium]
MGMEAQQVAVPVLARPTSFSDKIRAVRRRTLRFIVKQPTGAAGAFMVITIFVLAIGAPWIQRYDPLWQDYKEAVLAPSYEHFMGTDEFGRDLWS